MLMEGFQVYVVCQDRKLASCKYGSEVLHCIHNSQKLLIKGGVMFLGWVTVPEMELAWSDLISVGTLSKPRTGAY